MILNLLKLLLIATMASAALPQPAIISTVVSPAVQAIETGIKTIATTASQVVSALAPPTTTVDKTETAASKIASVASTPTILLNDGNRMPIVSLGTVGDTDIMDEVVSPAVVQAIEAGYRQIDTAAIYKNEEPVGRGIAEAISRGLVTREELWVTTKLPPTVGTADGVIPALQESLGKLKLDYVDLYLIHVPWNLYGSSEYSIPSIWEGMVEAKKLGLARSIGVSNFNSTHINTILAHSDVRPAANEIEVNPTYSSLEIVSYCQSQNITVLAYAPFGHMVPRPWVENPPATSFEEPILKQLAEKYGKTTSQIAIRYLMDRGMVPIPKSVTKEHILSNIDVLDFELTQEEVYQINELNQDFKVYYFDLESLSAFSAYYHF